MTPEQEAAIKRALIASGSKQTYEVQGQDGQTYEVQADSIEQAANSVSTGQKTFTLAQKQALAIARARRMLAESEGNQGYDAQGFPVQPQGGSSTNSQAVGELRSGLKSVTAGAANGASFGLADEGLGLAGGVASWLKGDGYMPGYEKARDDVRIGMDQAKQANPAEFGAGNIGGAMVPAIATAPFASGAGALGTFLRGTGIGALEGGLQGAGNADGQDILGQAKTGAVVGGLVGGAAPVVVGTLGALKNTATGIIDGALGIANAGKANRAIGKALASSGQDSQGVVAALTRAAQQGQPEYRLMDALGIAGQRQASGITRAGGEAATEIANFLEKRQVGQGERIGGFVDDAFGTKGTTAAKTRDSLTAARGEAADAAYGAARGNAAPVDVRGALGVIDARIGGMKGAGIAGDSIDGKLASYRAMLAGDGKGLGKDVTGAELGDFDRVLGVKQAVQDDIGAAIRAGRNNEARELGKLVTELDGALEGASDMYRAANDGFREASKVIGAVDDGASMATRGRAADNVPAFQAMNPEQQGAARVGYGNTVLDQLERVTAPTANRAKPLMSAKRDAEAQAMTLDPQLYAERLARENEMWATQNRALGGSRTADNMADQNAMSDLAGGVTGAVKSAANFQFGDMVSKLAGALGPLAKGQNEATRSLVVQALMSGDGAVLAPVLKQQAMSESTRRIIEALVRQPARQGGMEQAR
jgi:hypothetical protein